MWSRTDGDVTLWFCRAPLVALLVTFLPAALGAQTLSGRVLDASRRPLVRALIEIRDAGGRSLQTVLTSPTGAFQFVVPAPGRYSYRAAAIGFQPRPFAPVDVPPEGVIVADIVLTDATIRLPDLVAVGRRRYCGRAGAADAVFARMLESAKTALQVIEATISTRAVGFEVARITRRTMYGSLTNVEAADTTLQPLARWPIESIDPDTLRAVGFSRMLEPGDESTRQYFGPDARVLFAGWFLEQHCFTVDKPSKKSVNDTLHIRFTPAHKTELVDIAGELVLDRHDLALLQFTFTLTHLPGWMPEGAAGGEMQFSRLESGLWLTRTWAIWAPIGEFRLNSRRLRVGGRLESYGWVTRVYAGKDTVRVGPR